MRKLDFRVKYSVTLLSFVDSLSKWDHFVSGHVRKYFDSQYGISQEDQTYLETYSTLRKRLDWDREIDLLNWAYEGYPDNTEFNQFIDPIKYFENRTNNNGKTLKAELEEATNQIKKLIPEIKKRFEDLAISNTILKFTNLFDSPYHNGLLPCYLTYSPDKHYTQGGANGEGIYVQIPTDLDRDSQIKGAVEPISHEYLHKELHPGHYFENFPDEEIKKIYSQKFPNIYPDKFYSFVEEVVIYTLNDVMTFGENALEHKAYYVETDEKDLAFIWQAVQEIFPILEDYRNATQTQEETLNKLDIYFRGLVKSN